MDLSFIQKEKDFKAIITNLIEGVCSTNKLIGIGLDDIDKRKREELVATYRNLVFEEAEELSDAVYDKSRKEFLDAVVDTMVVGSYRLLLDKTRCKRNLAITQRSSIKELVGNFLQHLYDKNIIALYYTAADIFVSLDINHEKAVETVLRSNLSKFPTLEELNEAIHIYDMSGNSFDGKEVEYQIKDIEMRGRYTGVHCKKVIDKGGVERLTFWATHDNGVPKLKYVKPLTFVEPDFESCFYD